MADSMTFERFPAGDLIFPGQAVRIDATILTIDGSLYGGPVSATVRRPDGLTTPRQVVASGDLWRCDLDVPDDVSSSGFWRVRFESGAGAGEVSFRVRGSAFF
jgi:hypothetical protein